MSLPTPAQIKKLAAACRKAGIAHFKCGDIEFTLGDLPQPKAHNTPQKAQAKASVFNDKIETQDSWEDLTEEQKILYSVGGGLQLEGLFGGNEQ